NLEDRHEDDAVLERFIEIKKEKKQELADYIQFHEEVDADPESIFDIQIKRLHEYKRQLMMAFYIADLFNRIKEDPGAEWTKRTFIFGAKAAPGYYMAKAIIKFINELAGRVNKDVDTKDIIKVVFVENYGVSYAEKLFPAADVSEQISTAGKEASGTGNMKFMLNGAVTVGTMDGANVEIVEEAGEENNYIFGMEVDAVAAKRADYDPKITMRERKKIIASGWKLTPSQQSGRTMIRKYRCGKQKDSERSWNHSLTAPIRITGQGCSVLCMTALWRAMSTLCWRTLLPTEKRRTGSPMTIRTKKHTTKKAI